tara:strand:- start:445 stop:699 length:255 start_codon:yes stop_codon:yes gene_type:complete
MTNSTIANTQNYNYGYYKNKFSNFVNTQLITTEMKFSGEYEKYYYNDLWNNCVLDNTLSDNKIKEIVVKLLLKYLEKDWITNDY